MSDTAMMVTALGGATKAYTAYSAGKTNQSIDDFNANLEHMQADQVLQKEGFDAARVSEKADITQGTQRAAFSGQGVVVGAGTAQLVQDSARATSEMDKTIMAINANRAAYGHDVAASNLEFQGKQARRQGNMAALGDIIDTGASELAMSDPNYKGRGRGGAFSVDNAAISEVSPMDDASSHMSFT